MSRDSNWYERLEIHEAKTVDYLMSPTNEEGRHKRCFLMAHGFDDERPGMLVDALLAHAATAVEVSDATTVHGRKWMLRGRLRCRKIRPTEVAHARAFA